MKGAWTVTTHKIEARVKREKDAWASNMTKMKDEWRHKLDGMKAAWTAKRDGMKAAWVDKVAKPPPIHSHILVIIARSHP